MRVTRIRKAGQRCYSELGASRGAAAFSWEKLSVLRVEGTLLEGRDSVVLRARDGGWGECLQGDGTNSFCRRACINWVLERSVCTRRLLLRPGNGGRIQSSPWNARVKGAVRGTFHANMRHESQLSALLL